MSILSEDMKLDIVRCAFGAQENESAQVDLIVPFMEELAAEKDIATGSEAREIRIRLNSDGDITLMTSTKLSNLRFRWKDALLGGIPQVGSIEGAWHSHPLLMPFLVLGFLKFVRQLSTLQIEETDANVIMRLLAFKFDAKVIDMDEFSTYMMDTIAMNRLQLDQSLDRLERLGIISCVMGEVIVNEVVVVRRQEF